MRKIATFTHEDTRLDGAVLNAQNEANAFIEALPLIHQGKIDISAQTVTLVYDGIQWYAHIITIVYPA